MAADPAKRSALARLAAFLRGSALMVLSGALLVLGIGSLLLTTCLGALTSGGTRSTSDTEMLKGWLLFGAIAAGMGLMVGVGWVARYVTAESTRRKMAGLPPAAIAPGTAARLRVWLAGVVLAGVAIVAASAITGPLSMERWLSLGLVAVAPGGLALLLLLPAPRIWGLDLAMAVPFHWAIVGLWPARIHPGRLLLDRAPATLAGPPRFIVAVTVGVVVYAFARQCATR